MVLGWRRAFCTSIPRDGDSTKNSSSSSSSSEKQDKFTTPKLSSSSKFSSFFSNASTPRLQSHQHSSSPSLHCRTTTGKTTATKAPPPPTTSLPPAESPRLQCKTAKNSPRFFRQRCSTPSSPRSPSTFSLLNPTLRSSKIRCGICLHSIKSGQGTAIFTAECSHSFHFPCVAGHVKQRGSLICPVCNSTWTEMPLLSIHNVVNSSTSSRNRKSDKEDKTMEFPMEYTFKTKPPQPPSSINKLPVLKVYNDDEPLTTPTCGARFNPIPESDENDEDDDNIIEEFQGFSNSSPLQKSRNVETMILPDAAVVSVGRSSQTCVFVLKIRAPPAPTKVARRAPIDLVTVLDVSGKLTNEKLQLMKRAMRLMISSLSAADRLSIVAFSSASKRLLPLRRMTTAGRRSALRIVDSIASLNETIAAIANDAIKKAVKVLDDRREKNPVASIILFSDVVSDSSANQTRHSSTVCATRLTNFDVPVLSVGLNHYSACPNAPPSDDALAKCIGGLLSVMVQDLKIHLGVISGSSRAEIAGIYSYTGRPMSLGSGLIHLGEFFAEEERELVVELKIPSAGAHHVLSVRCSYKDPSTREIIQVREQALWVPRPQAVRSSTPSIQRLRSFFVATRGVAECRRLVERNDLAGAHRVLSSARALILQTGSNSAEEYVRSLEVELHLRIQNQAPQMQRRQNVESEPLTPTSAWRAAERLAKVAIMRKSMNRVSDLHGFENARF